MLLLLLGGPGSVAAQTICAENSTAVNNRGSALAADCTTLLGLMDELRGTATLNWATDVAMDSWDGITVAGIPARVTELYPRGILTGTLPTALSGLTGLRRLSLSSNGLTGSIPDLSALTRLTELALNGTQLTGSIPDLSALTSLTLLNLSFNGLTGSIPDLSALTRLTLLNLHNNQLTGPIPDLSALTRLEALWLGFNNFTAGPIPSWVNTLTSLTHLDLSDNDLTGSIPDLSALTSLTELDLSDNDLTGSIPDLSALTRLTELALNDNQLTGSIPDLSALTSLTELDLNDNQLTGSIPDLSALTRLTLLDLRYNQLTGSIPDLSALTSLTELDLSDNDLTRPIPALSALTSLTHLDLSDNDLTGSIPDLSALTRLTELDLSDNDLTGSIPDLSALTRLEVLRLGFNNFTGSIPDLSALTSLRRLSLSSNRLTRPIPDLSALTSLTELDLSDNQLTGSIPDLSALTRLEVLRLGFNNFTGPIPALSALTSLETLWLSHNQLTGSIPDLSALTRLEVLRLGFNNFTGPIPALSALTSLETLWLSHNQLTGSIPALSALTSLRWLDLSDNQLTGSIPATLGTLPNLKELDLSYNQLTGSLPLNLRNRPDLTLALQGNLSDFSGTDIPITTAADTLTPAFAAFDLGTDPCGTIVDLAAFPATPTLREALIYANQATEPVTITFDSSLAGQTISLADGTDPDSDPDPLPRVCGGHLTLAGDIDADGTSDITLDGTGLPTDAHGLTITSSHNTIAGLTLTHMPNVGIWVFSLGEGVTQRGNRITNNTITGGAYGILLQAGATGSGDVVGTLSDTRVDGNTVSETTTVGIAVLTAAPGATLTDTIVEENEVFNNTGQGIAAWAQADNAPTLTDSLTSLTIRDNHVHNQTTGNGIAVTSGYCGGGYNRVKAEIVGNTLVDNGQADIFADIAAGAGTNASAVGCTVPAPNTTTGNHLDVTITDNRSADTPDRGIFVYGGFESSDLNSVTATVARNAVWRSGTAGISVLGGGSNSDHTTVTATLNDNLIARTTALAMGTAGHGLVLQAAAAVPEDSTSSHNTLTVSGRGNVIALKRTATDTAPDLLRQQNNGSSRTGNTVTDRLTGTLFTTQDDDGTFVEVPPVVPVTIPDAHPEVADSSFTAAASDAVSSEAGLPAHTQRTAGGIIFDITVADANGTRVEAPLTVPVQVCLPIPAGVSSSQAYVLRYNDADPGNPIWERLTSGRRLQNGQVCAAVAEFSYFTVGRTRRSTTGGGGGDDSMTDTHGDTPATATALSLSAQTPTTHTPGRLGAATDLDYFRFSVPYAGLLSVETTGRTNTVGSLLRADEGGALASDDDSGPHTNFRLAVPVPAGAYVLEVSGSPGPYTLVVQYRAGYFENPQPDSPQSGIGVLSGWVCAADRVTIEFERPSGTVWRVPAAAGTLRPDTASVCGHAESGFGLLWNWNKLGPGAHTVRAVVDDVVLAEHDITVTTLGLGEFPTGLSGAYALEDFPAAGETTQLQWSQAQQNFVLVSGEGGGAGWHRAMNQAVLENPQAGSFQSGIGVISGWVCDAEAVTIAFENGRTGETFTLPAGYGTPRTDTAPVCGHADTGFGLLWNWNRLGDGPHTVRALADGEEVAWSMVTVTTLGEEFVRGLAGEFALEDFPTRGQTVTVEWQEAQQNFVLTDRE